MFNDLRHGVRVLLQAKGWTAVVVLSLALGIGANTALFSAINGLLLKQLSVKDPDTLVRLRYVGRNQMATNSSDYGTSNPIDGQQVRTTFSYPMFQQFVAENRTLSDLFACAPTGRVNVVVDGNAALADGFLSSGNYFRVLGVSAQLGRLIEPSDDQPGAPAVAVLGDRYWRTRFAADPSVIGRGIVVSGVPVTIVGVLPPEYRGVQRAMGDARDVSMPLSLDDQVSESYGRKRLSRPTYYWLQVMGRLKEGVAPAQVHANLAAVFDRTARAGWESYVAALPEAERNTSEMRERTSVPRLVVDSGSRGVYDASPNDVRAVTILSVVVALVLLMVCANVANLLLSRAGARGREISVRLSLGATRARVIRQLLTESLLLAVCGGALGIVVSYWGQSLLPGVLSQRPPLDWRTLAFIFAITTTTAVVFGTLPAVRATGLNVSAALKESGRSVVGARGILSKSLLIAQVAISVLLLVGAGLFLRTVDNLRRVDVGFNTSNLLVFRVNPQLNRYDENRQGVLYGEMVERLQAVGGVRAVALSQPGLLTAGVSGTTIFVRGKTYQPGEAHDINRLIVSPGFFDTMELPLLAGRGFSTADHATAPKVGMVNETAARKYLSGDPIGQRYGHSTEDNAKIEIVGVVRDAKYSSIRDAVPPTLYVPYLQNPTGNAIFELRTAGDPLGVVNAVREAVRQIDPNLPVTDVSTQLAQAEGRFLQEKTFAQAYALFGGLTMAIAAIGLFGVMSHSVARRTNEIGIRMALGAQSGDMLRLVMRESMVLVIVGIVLGAATALVAGRLVANLLFGLAATDASTMAIAVALMIGVSAIASYLPARRASRIDPMVALRYE